ncbi:serine protease inhibitor 88Ea-like [Nylanderia fulva]|uniref:serine protease inhibitor 88Ea-like n=1 Tax=Nylanderia fulva TaxID=613905 RepID=UPI0010FAD371|nr:serine protease inhibitor 88Ea-like [Nylanderia fulva]
MEHELKKTFFYSVISDAIFKFALTSLHKYATIKPKEDFVFSPYSIYQELFSVYLISSGDIEQRLKNILYLPNVPKYEMIKNIKFNKYAARHHKYPTNRPAEYEDTASCVPHYAIQNKCTFINTILRDDIEIIKKLYNLGFLSKKSNDIQDINRKITKVLEILTKDNILKPLKLKVKTEDLDIILMNVHNFHGRNQLILKPIRSWSVDQLISIIPMSSFLKFKTFSSDELQVDVKELIIKKDFTSLYMLTPFSSITLNEKVETDTSSTSLSSLIERLSTIEGMHVLRKLLSCKNEEKDKLPFVSTQLIFEIEKNLDMQVLLRELGVEQLLTPDAIPLDNTFAEDNQFVHFGNAVHRARVKVTEDNVTATAVTLISGQEPSSNDIISNMYLNYPFVWLIYDKMNADILYIGVFNKVDKNTGTLLNEINFSEWFHKQLYETYPSSSSRRST